MSIASECPEVKRSKKLVGPRGKMSEWLRCLLGLLLLMWKVCLMCFCVFHFLKDTWDVESYHSSLSPHVYPDWAVYWVDMGGGCYRLVTDHGSPLGLDGMCVGHACMSVACVSLTLAFHMIIAFA